MHNRCKVHEALTLYHFLSLNDCMKLDFKLTLGDQDSSLTADMSPFGVEERDEPLSVLSEPELL